MTLFSNFLTTTWRIKTQLYLFNELQLHSLLPRASYYKISLNGLLLKSDSHRPVLFFSSNITHLNRPTVENSPTLQHGNLIVKISNKINNLSAILALLNEIFKLKDEKATAIVVENKLHALTFYYHNLQNEEKEEFFKTLATKHAVDRSSIMKLSKQLGEIDPQSGIMLKTEEKLKDALTPQFYWLFVHLGRLHDGVKFLVDLRSDILSLLSSSDVKSPHHIPLQQLNSVLKGLLNLWFSVGFLHLERVTWSSPCCLLQKISEYEAVHPVRSWTDIRKRVGPYRRCFVYTHHSMPGEPLVVLHVALTQEISDSMKSVISKFSRIGDEKPYQSNIVEDKNNIKAFIFYSISSTQKGLQGIDLGNYLIKRAAKELHAEYPQAVQFSSLSPIPSFRQWLLDKIKLAEKGESVLPAGKWDEVVKLLNPEDEADAWGKLRSMITDNSWIHNENLVSALKLPLMVSCGRYLYMEKRRGYAFDSVANFHLRNGAVMWRLNWLADTSPRGLSQSCGLMINYRYYLDAADKNSQQYIKDRTIPASEQIINLSVNSKL